MTETTEQQARPTDDDPRRALRRFFLHGPSEDSSSEVRGPKADVLPALLAPYRGAGRVRTDYPLFLGAAGASGILCLGFPELAERAQRTMEGEGRPAGQILRDNLKRLERGVLEEAKPPAEDEEADRPAPEVLRAAGRAMARDLDLAAEDRDALLEDVERFAEALPGSGSGASEGDSAGGTFVAPRPTVHFALLRHALLDGRRSVRQAFVREARELVARGRALLDADRRKGSGARDPKEVETGMGSLGSKFVNAERMTSVLGERRGSAAMAPERRKKLEQAVADLEKGVEKVTDPTLCLIHDGTSTSVGRLSKRTNGFPNATGWTIVESSDPCAVAAETWDREAGRLAAALRGRERLELEVAGEYEEERHEPWLERLEALDWRAFEADDLALVTPVVALESASELAERGMVSLSKLLRSARPVQVVVEIEPAADPGADQDAAGLGYRFEPGYLGVSHREAFVQQSSGARPLHLMEGYLRAATSARAALHVVAAWPEDVGEIDLDPALIAGAAVEGRAHPLFRYDPEGGPRWAHRIAFDGNPQPEADWPQPEDGEGEPFTFADFALLDPALRRHLRPLTAEEKRAVAEELVPVAEWLDLPTDDAMRSTPAVTGVDASGGEVLLVVSRPLAMAARDRLGFWRTLQELAGVKSEYARRAAEATREEVEQAAKAERERLEKAHAAELERVRQQAARQAVDRLTSALLDVDLGLFAEAAPSRTAPSLAGKSVDEVTDTLVAAIGGVEDTDLDDPDTDEAAEKLLSMIDLDSLEQDLEQATE